MTDHNFVERYYQMNPETEDMLPNGGAIRNGMIVLIADPDQRVIVKEAFLDWELDRALVRNRWAKVSHVMRDNSSVVFIAEYEDGTKKQRMVSFRSAWLVKKASMPDDEEVAQQKNKKDTELRTKILLFVKSALMVKQEMDEHEDEKCSPMTMSRIADQTAGDIMALFEGEK